MQKKQIKILIAYDLRIIGEGLAALLKNESNFNVIDSLENEDLKFDFVKQHKPDVILFEFARWPKHYLDYIKQISIKFPGLKILILSELISHNSLMELLVYIHGYLLKTCSSKKIFFALQEVFDSGKYLCPKIIDEISGYNKSTEDALLTFREREILSFWLTSADNNEIANNLNISESTVRTHLNNIKQKSGSLNKIQMMVYACKNNILNNGLEPICPNCKFSCQKVMN